MDSAFITCKICSKKFTDPCHLECLHDFCKECIRNDLKQNLSTRLDAYSCPICKQLTPTKNKSPEDWVEQLPPSDFVSALTEVYKLKIDDVYCSPCNRKRRSTTGSKWCRTCRETLCINCLDVHGSLKTTMKHTILDLQEVKSRETKKIIFDPNCMNHEHQPLTSFCEAHDELICSLCTGEKHKDCTSIRTVNDEVRVKSHDIQDISSKTSEHLQITNNALQSSQASLRELDNSFLNLSNSIRSVRKRIDEMLSKYERKSLEKLAGIENEFREKLQHDIQKLESLNAECSHTNQLLGNVKDYGTDGHILQCLQQVRGRNVSHSTVVEEYKEMCGLPTVNFVINSQLDDVLNTLTSVGELVVNDIGNNKKTQQLPSKSRQTEHKPKPTEIKRRLADKTVSVRTRSDENVCLITGILSLPSLDWLLCDKGNKKLKLYDSQFQIKSEHILEQTPYDTTCLDDHVVAVTVPEEMKILVFRVLAGINLQEELKINDRCYGISYSSKEDKFVVTCPFASPASVRILSRKGEELMNLTPEENLQSLFLRPWYVAFDGTGNSYFVSDSQRNRVTSITRSVYRRFHYTHANMKSPRGLAMTSNGEMFIAGWGSDTVHRVDENGRLKEEFLSRHDGIISPQAVCVSKDNTTLALSLDQTSCRSDLMQIFLI
ncbi:tripartite motif-containing protein 2-like [Saccostrea echinata]|uniref:tripartite motif-containing protein 2-like n=1 Tax=Saccostrea echinata TaxID=191078 RepID=UPI002A825230|nr:tripartite motif-containing protein 2-like [Saccostrea echinata]